MSVYGIDLGTTNSLIGLGEELLSGLVPSIVDFDTRKVGISEKDNPKAKRSFKVDIGMGKEGSMSVAASRLVLEELKRQAKVSGKMDAIITVPADFNDSQRKATARAAELANINVIRLINEPTAAALYVSRGRKALSVVFDLGGGTFDVSVIDSRLGSYDVQFSKGDPRCGGDNLDINIMKNMMKTMAIQVYNVTPEQRFRLQKLACDMKIRMQKECAEFDIDLSEYGVGTYTFTPDMYKQLVMLSFRKCIVMLNDVIANSIPFGERYSIILVGGSTRCPYLRKWIADETGVVPEELFYDPDRVVAQGASLFGQMCEKGEADVMVFDVTKALSIGMDGGFAQVLIEANSKTPIEETTMAYNSTEGDKLVVDLYQGDSALVKNNSYVGTLKYDFGEAVAAMERCVEITVAIDTSGRILLSCREPCKKAVSVSLEVK